MKYLVMECHAAYAVLMDEASRFVRAANLHYTVGQTVTAPVLMQEDAEAPRSRRGTVIRIAAAAACLLLLSGAGLHAYFARQKAKSSVRICSELEFEMQLNRDGEVIRISSSTENGQAMLEDYRPDKKDMLQVVSELLAMQREQGYLAEGETVSIYIDSDDNRKFEEYKTGLESEVPKLNVQVSVQEGIAVPPAEVEDPAGSETEQTADGRQPVHQPAAGSSERGQQVDGPAEAEHTRPQPPDPPAVTAPAKQSQPQGPVTRHQPETGTRPTAPAGHMTVTTAAALQPAGPDPKNADSPEGPLPPNAQPEPAGPPAPPVFAETAGAERTEPAVQHTEPADQHTEPAAQQDTETAAQHDETPAPETQRADSLHPDIREEQSAPAAGDSASPHPEPPNPQAAETPQI
ncbi:MAG: hypothetical protein II723_05115 [Oscillospiraceae bacterium]|nr:hypothetical protein [Oscillospiraceae bacterium]